jgi:hypothetical protein
MTGLLADAFLIDKAGSQVLQVSPKGYEKHDHDGHSFPFRIGEGLEAVITGIRKKTFMVETSHAVTIAHIDVGVALLAPSKEPTI